jgi:hypothetical protein
VNVEDDAIRLAHDGAMQVFLRGLEGLGADPVAAKRTRECSTQRRIVIHNANPGTGLAVRLASLFSCCHATSDNGHKLATLPRSVSASPLDLRPTM